MENIHAVIKINSDLMAHNQLNAYPWIYAIVIKLMPYCAIFILFMSAPMCLSHS